MENLSGLTYFGLIGLNKGSKAFFISKWIGTMVRYLWFRGKRPFEELYRDKHSRVNFLIGYGLHLIFVVTIVLLLVFA